MITGRAFRRCGICFALLLMLPVRPVPAEDSIMMIATTSIENSGLQKYLLPRLEAATGVLVQSAPMGTGQALRMARDGNADLLIVHDKDAEERFMAAGFGRTRAQLMHNYFLLVGPAGNPAAISEQDPITVAMVKLFDSKTALFLSRGDDSGTHQRELRLWRVAGLDPHDMGRRYRSAGSGMGRTLLIAANQDTHTIVDEATWYGFRHKQDLVVLQGKVQHPVMRNVYSVIVVDHPAREAGRQQLAGRVAAWLTGEAGQSAIREFSTGDNLVFQPVGALAE